MPREEIAMKLGVSLANLKRSLSGVPIWFQNGKHKNQPEQTRAVIEYYQQHGMRAAVERFPDISVRSLVERPEYYGLERVYRQMRWTDEQKVELVRMAGIVSYGAQAKYFGRPGAAGGSIKAAWVKIFGRAPASLNGMQYDTAKHIALPGTPFIHAHGQNRRGDPIQWRWTVLWVDLENSLRPELPDFQKAAVKTMADFQRWLWGSKNPKAKIINMIREREV